jgi:hypothetical protein
MHFCFADDKASFKFVWSRLGHLFFQKKEKAASARHVMAQADRSAKSCKG